MTKYACYHRAVMPSGRAARALLPGCALTFALAASGNAAPAGASFTDLLTELTGALVDALRPAEQVQVVASDAGLGRDLGLGLVRRGVRVVDGEQTDSTRVVVSCVDTLTERLCAAELRRAESRQLVSVHRTHGREPAMATALPSHAPTSLVLTLQPLLSQTVPILDVASTGPHLLVLHPSMVARYQRDAGGWRVQDTRPIVTRRVWPRDVRGRLVADGARFEAFLPGAWCRGAADPFELTCVDEERPWPLGFENSGLAPQRNYFASPDGTRFFAAVPLGPGAGARWLSATSDGRLVFLDAGRTPLDGAALSADDVASLSTSCASGDLVLVPERPSVDADGDALRLFRAAARRLVAVTPAAALPGTLTALWSRGGTNGATAVCHNPTTGLYEAFQVAVSCGR